LAKGFEVTVRGEDMTAFTGKDNPIAGGPTEENLASTVSIQSDHREIVAQAEKIVSSNDPDIEKVRKLVNWTSTKIKHRVKDSFTALSVLRDGEGECQAHANLYTALARSQKIPTRVVTGLVYTEEVGFLYHAWAESYVNRWDAVDPTLNQVPADATHIKLYTGDSGDAIHSLLKMVGKVKIEVLEFK
jgi:transglutaminase-like putative cysteine protease